MFSSAGKFEMKPLVVSSRVDVVLQHEVVALYCASLLSLENVQKVAALEVGVEYEWPVVPQVYPCLALDLWEVAGFGLGVDYYACHWHEYGCEVLLAGGWLEAGIIGFFFAV
jgi:hypothetical protein